MEKITFILDRKQPHFHTVSPNALVMDALQQMHCENVNYLVVIGDDESFMGVLSDHDIASKIIFRNMSLKKTSVKDVMNTRLPVATVEDTVEKCMRIMRQHNVRLIPVFEGYTFKGVVSSEDIIHEIVSNRMNVFDAEANEEFLWA
jgi:CBS domain-containing protein